MPEAKPADGPCPECGSTATYERPDGTFLCRDCGFESLVVDAVRDRRE
ncbi:hypothetical protein [Halobaculum sp. D14]